MMIKMLMVQALAMLSVRAHADLPKNHLDCNAGRFYLQAEILPSGLSLKLRESKDDFPFANIFGNIMVEKKSDHHYSDGYFSLIFLSVGQSKAVVEVDGEYNHSALSSRKTFARLKMDCSFTDKE